MQLTDEQPAAALERALAGLQQERQFCVKRLEEALHAHEDDVEIAAFLRQIDNINSRLIRLAGAHVS